MALAERPAGLVDGSPMKASQRELAGIADGNKSGLACVTPYRDVRRGVTVRHRHSNITGAISEAGMFRCYFLSLIFLPQVGM